MPYQPGTKTDSVAARSPPRAQYEILTRCLTLNDCSLAISRRFRLSLTLIQREFTVGIPVQSAWDHLAHLEQWPSWAPHIKKIELQPPGTLGPQSTGVTHL